MNSHLYLIGYRATGKSSVAQLLGNQLHCQVYDLDQIVSQEAGRSIAQIFQNAGEPEFRRLESKCLEEVSILGPAVVSLGGGTVLAETNREIIKSTGRAIWLRASAAVIFERMQADPNNSQNRPALSELPELEEIESLLEQRSPTYADCAEYAVDTSNLTIDQIAQRIVKWWEKVDN